MTFFILFLYFSDKVSYILTIVLKLIEFKRENNGRIPEIESEDESITPSESLEESESNSETSSPSESESTTEESSEVNYVSAYFLNYNINQTKKQYKSI